MKIINMLLERNNINVDVVSSVAIVGLGGIGPQMVCNDSMVKAFFQKQIWIHVAHSFDVQAILHALFGDHTGISS